MEQTVTLAAIQLKNDQMPIPERLARAEALVEQAHAQGAQLAALCELSSCGYIPNDSIWERGEPRGGKTAVWAKTLAKRLCMYIGAGFLECDGKDFYNSYLIASPEGEIAGIVRKRDAETYCFRSGDAGVCIATRWGKIAVGICADNHQFAFYERVAAENPVLLLQPHAWPTPYREGGYVKKEDILAAQENVRELPRVFARGLNAAVLFVNAAGETAPMRGFWGMMMKPETFRLNGGSQIVDAGGASRGLLCAEEGILVAEVCLGRIGAPQGRQPESYGGWLHPGSALLRKTIIPLDAALGRRYYRCSKARKALAARFQ